ncbi:MFS transporter [Streptomyces sp900105245]|uniref:MFS transporter n=1 Tax=Streptomyces sp. 900105245 TaxID=3154379 RepID=UPI00331949E1
MTSTVLDPPTTPTRTTTAPAGPAASASPGYRRLLTSPHVPRLLTGAVVGHLPVAMAPLALLIAVRAQGGSVGLAGLLAAAFGVSAAVAQPGWATLLERRGQTVTLLACGLGTAGCFLGLAVVRPAGQPVWALLLSVAAGLCTAPLEAALRALWPEVTRGPAQLRTALSLDACAQEVVFIAGPLLVLALGVTVGGTATLVAIGLLGLAGTLAFATARPARHWRPAPAAPGPTCAAPTAPAGFAGPLRYPGTRTLASALLCAGVALGALNVLALAFAEHDHDPALTTVMPAALAAGSLIGSLLYGRLRRTGTLAGHARVAAFGLLAGLGPLLLEPAPAAAVLVAVVPGLFLAPLLINVFAGLDQVAPSGMLHTAAAWMITSLGLGQAAGTALASTAVGAAAPLATALTGAAAAFAVLLLRRSSLAPHRPRPRTTANHVPGRSRPTPAHRGRGSRGPVADVRRPT